MIRERLDLNELEIFDTRADIRECALMVGIAAVSISLAILGRDRYAGLSGMTYMLTPVVMTAHGVLTGRRRRKLEARFGSKQDAVLAGLSKP